MGEETAALDDIAAAATDPENGVRIHVPPADCDGARGRFHETQHQPQKSRLAASAGPDQHCRASGFDFEVDLAQGRDFTESVGDAFEPDHAWR